MKGVQIAATTGVLENCIGYYIAQVKSASVMMVTKDADLAKQRMDLAITPLLQESGLMHLIRSNDQGNGRKTGKTDTRLDWIGGGFLIPHGAINPDKFRSLPIRIMLRDEIDAWDDVVGKDGDPLKLTEDRTAAYEDDRKILDISTPLIKGQSKIEKQFQLGDQRYYFVNCISCGHSQRLRWQRVSPEGVVSGIWWDEDEKTGELVPGSVRYLCESCGYAHTNDDKTRLLAPENGAQWVPTEKPSSPDFRSYHLSALYSPVGMQTWEALVRKWKEAWDTVNNRVKDYEKLQVFYNNVLGETYELRGEKLKFEVISRHRRRYKFGEIPNKWATEFAGGPILLLVCTVDVHIDNLAVSVFGWCAGGRAFLINYDRFEGDTEQTTEPKTWGKLRELIEGRQYTADDGKRYQIAVTLIDSGYRRDQVYQFAADYQGGVFPVKGRGAEAAEGANLKEFSEFTTTLGTIAYGITVDIYKDRWSAQLKRSWDGNSAQPEGFFNAPLDIDDDQLRELTVEVKREKLQKGTGKRVGTEWHRPSGAKNELWDTLIYASAAVEMIARDVCIRQWELKFINWTAFWDACRQQKLFFLDPVN